MIGADDSLTGHCKEVNTIVNQLHYYIADLAVCVRDRYLFHAFELGCFINSKLRLVHDKEVSLILVELNTRV